MTDPHGEARIFELFDRALQVPEERRDAFVRKAAGDDPALAAEVLDLLRIDAGGAPSRIVRLPVARDPASTGVRDAPDRIGPYHLVRILGRGGMGTVHLAEQLSPVRRRVAVKRLDDAWWSGDVLTRFDAERHALARMEHPSIAKVYDAGVEPAGGPFFVMEFVDGEPIDRFCDHRQLDLRARLRVVAAVCRAVQHAHDRGVIHRDLKPGNILVATDADPPLPKVIDFGVAKALSPGGPFPGGRTAVGTVLGTPEYMSPEQAAARSAGVDTRTDIYSLGVVLYRLACGCYPLHAERRTNTSLLEALRVVVDEDAPAPSARFRTLARSDPAAAREVAAARRNTPTSLRAKLRGDLDRIVLCAMAKDPAHRYASAAAFAADIERALSFQPVEAAAPGAAYRLRKLLRRHRAHAVAIGLAAVAVLGATMLALWGAAEARAAIAAEQDAQRRQVQGTDPLRVADLLARARRPWPVTATAAEDRAWIDDWIAEADGVRARGVSAPGAFAAWDELARWRPRMVERRDRVARHAPLWERCRAALAANPAFAGVEVRPVPGLLPLGPDLDHDPERGRQVGPLWVFACGGTGAIPAWVDRAGRPVPPGQPGLARIEDDTAVLMVLLPGGSGWVGSQIDDPDAPCYSPSLAANAEARRRHGRELGDHHRRIECEPFFMAKCEVTQAQFQRFLEATGRAAAASRRAAAAADPRRAAFAVDFREAQDFASWLGGELPSAVLWEYACRAGTTTEFWCGDDEASLRDVAWYRESAGADRVRGVAHGPGGRPAPNPWGLHDMHGNVWEWCEEPAPADGAAAAAGLQREVRGGAANDPWVSLRAANRYTRPAGMDYMNPIGIRPILRLPEPR